MNRATSVAAVRGIPMVKKNQFIRDNDFSPIPFPRQNPNPVPDNSYAARAEQIFNNTR